MTKISIIIPVYNVEKYISRCIESIIIQTFKDWELLLINDGSIDSSGNICEIYAKRDWRIKIIQKRNGGVSETRNLGLDMADGEYITFIDADDWIEPDYLEKMYDDIKKMNVEILITGYIIEKEDKIINKFIPRRRKVMNIQEAKLELLKQEIYSCTVYDKLYKKEVLRKERFNTKLKIGEDLLFFWNLINKISLNKIGYVPLYKYHYDVSASNTMTSEFSVKWIKPVKIKEKIFLEVKDLSNEHRFYANKFYIYDMIALIEKANKSSKYNTKFLIKILRKKIQKNIKYNFELNSFRYNDFKFRLKTIIFSIPLIWKIYLLLKYKL